MPGLIVHFEIPADDTARGREFWGTVFGWKFTPAPLPFEYHTTRIGDEAGAAITNMEPGKRGARVCFDVDDIDAGARRVRELGGEASDRRPVPGIGGSRFAKTPRTTIFGLWQNDPNAPA
jgi:uncharacterized protein